MESEHTAKINSKQTTGPKGKSNQPKVSKPTTTTCTSITSKAVEVQISGSNNQLQTQNTEDISSTNLADTQITTQMTLPNTNTVCTTMERDRVHFSLHLSIYIINLDVNTVRDDGAEKVRV